MKEVIELPPGEYYIGDPCYVIGKGHRVAVGYRDCWIEFLEETDYCRDPNKQEYRGIKFFASNTAYGDGCYPAYVKDIGEFSFPVDAGMLGVIPVELIDSILTVRDQVVERDLGVFVTVDKSFKCSRNEQGTFFVEGITEIPTSDFDEDKY